MVAALHDPNGDIVYLLTQIDTTPINIVPARILRYNLDDWSLDSTLDLPNVVLDDTAVIGIPLLLIIICILNDYNNITMMCGWPVILLLLDSRGENIYITDGDDITEINVATKSMSVGKTVSSKFISLTFLTLYTLLLVIKYYYSINTARCFPRNLWRYQKWCCAYNNTNNNDNDRKGCLIYRW